MHAHLWCIYHKDKHSESTKLVREHSRSQRPRSFWSAPRIATSGLLQRHSVFEWPCKHNRLRPEPIRFVKLDYEHAQSDGKSVNRGRPVLDLARGRDSCRYLVSFSLLFIFLRKQWQTTIWQRQTIDNHYMIKTPSTYRDSWCWPKGARPLGTRMVREVVRRVQYACVFCW